MGKDGNQGQRVYPYPTPKDDLAKLEEIIDDCIIALTSYTLGEDKITSYDEVVIGRPKLVSKTAQLIKEAKQQAVEEYVIALVGEKCPDYEEGCTVCHAHALKEALND